MIYWLITGGNNGGDQHATPAKLRAVLESTASAPAPNATFTFSLVTAPVTDPFSVFTEHNFGPDKRTRLVLFVTNVDLFSGKDLSLVSVKTEGAISFAVEYVGKVPNFSWLTQIKVRVPEELANAGYVRFTVSLRGLTRNPAHINIK